MNYGFNASLLVGDRWVNEAESSTRHWRQIFYKSNTMERDRYTKYQDRLKCSWTLKFIWGCSYTASIQRQNVYCSHVTDKLSLLFLCFNSRCLWWLNGIGRRAGTYLERGHVAEVVVLYESMCLYPTKLELENCFSLAVKLLSFTTFHTHTKK